MSEPRRLMDRRRAYLARYRACPPCYVLRRSRRRRPKRLFGLLIVHEGFGR